MNNRDQHLNSENDVLRMSNVGVRPTAVRLLIYRFMKSSPNPVSSLDIEAALETVDRSTISRALSVFLENDIIHSIDDGSGLLKYEVCRGEHDHSIHDMHVQSVGRLYVSPLLPYPKLNFLTVLLLPMQIMSFRVFATNAHKAFAHDVANTE